MACRRKMSFPVTSELPVRYYGRRRFSQVSDVVSRKFSHTLGWGHPRRQMAAEEVMSQAKSLCGQYMRARIRRSAGTLAKKLGLQRARSAASLPLTVRDVLPQLLALGKELERLHPKVYTGVMRQTCHVVSEKGVAVVLPAVARQLMSTDGGVSWPKVASLYAVAGGLALDCVSQGHPEFLQIIVESMSQAFEQDIALWIVDNGGWVNSKHLGLLQYCKPEAPTVSVRLWWAAVALLITALFVLSLAVFWFKIFKLL